MQTDPADLRPPLCCAADAPEECSEKHDLEFADPRVYDVHTATASVVADLQSEAANIGPFQPPGPDELGFVFLDDRGF